MASNEEQRLVAAALECFIAFGVHGTTLNDVAKRADVSRSSVYRTLGPKRRLTARVAEAEVRRFLREAATSLPEGATLDETVAELVDFALAWLRNEPFPRRIIEHEPEIVLSALIETEGSRGLIPLVSGHIAGLLERVCATKELRVSWEQAAESIVRMTISILLTPSIEFRTGHDLANQLVHGIAHPK